MKKIILSLGNAASLYSRYADKQLLFVFRNSKNDTYEYYEVYFGKRNFMHLAGIKSKTMNAIAFFEACLSRTVKLEDCTPSHDMSTMLAKISVLEKLLDFRNAKLYKIGKKDLVTRDNDFEMMTGNASGIIGYDSRVKEAGSKNVSKKHLPVPTTVLTVSIMNYCRKPKKIMFVLEKSVSEEEYSTITYEIKKGLLQQELTVLSEDIKSRIHLDFSHS